MMQLVVPGMAKLADKASFHVGLGLQVELVLNSIKIADDFRPYILQYFHLHYSAKTRLTIITISDINRYYGLGMMVPSGIL